MEAFSKNTSNGCFAVDRELVFIYSWAPEEVSSTFWELLDRIPKSDKLCEHTLFTLEVDQAVEITIV